MQLIISVIFLVLLRDYVSGDLCSTKPFQSCSYQLWPEGADNNDCLMTYYVSNGDDCKNKSFRIMNSGSNVDEVTLQAVPAYQTNIIPIFNNIQWTNLRMRFTVLDFEHWYMCRDFEISQNATIAPGAVLKYDCLWFNPDYEGRDFSFEYEYEQNNKIVGRKYIFTAPLHENIVTSNLSKYQLFTYVDVSNLPELDLKIRSVKFNVKNYEVRIICQKYGGLEEVVVVSLPKDQERNGIINYSYNTYNDPGLYYFEVRAQIESGKWTNMSKTPKYFIPKGSKVLYIGIVGVAAMAAVALMVMFIWRRQCGKQGPGGRHQLHRILLLYTPSNEEHQNVVLSLRHLLNDCYNVDVMLDVLQVPLTESKDPIHWYNQAFKDATHIVYIHSPDISVPTVPAYTNLNNLALGLLNHEFFKKGTSKNLIVLLFPYSPIILPFEINDMKCYNLLDNLSSFLNNFEKRQVFEASEFPSSQYVEDLEIAVKCAEISFSQSNFKRSCDELNKEETERLVPSSADEFQRAIDVHELNLLGTSDGQDSDSGSHDLPATCINIHDLDL